jgi:hypothetical protein
MRLLEAIMKAVWGTDEKCRQQRAEGDRMLARAEKRVSELNAVLHEKPPRNLDEAIYEMTRPPGMRE